MDVIQECFEWEFNFELIIMVLFVMYYVWMIDGMEKKVENLVEMFEVFVIKEICELYVKVQIMVFNDYVGVVMELVQCKWGEFDMMEYLDSNWVNVVYYILLFEIIFDFFDKLKLNMCGYVLLDYDLDGYCVSDFVKIDILLNGD